jgi:YaiO family outer membrane protein
VRRTLGRAITRALALIGLCLLALGQAAAQGSDPIDAGRALARTGRLEDAVAAYTRILEAKPDDLEARKERGRVLGWLGRNHEALDDFDRVLAVTPRDAEARLGRGRILARLQRYPEAEAEYRRAFADDPRAAAEAWVEIGRVRFWQEDRAGARTAYDEALRLEPTNAEARQGLAVLAAAPSPWQWRLDAGFRFDALTEGNSNWYWEWGRLAFRPWKGTTVIAGIDQYHRFDKNDTQASIGVAQDLPHGFTVSGSFAYGFTPSVVANQIYAVEIAQSGWIPKVIPSLRYQHSDFPGSVHVDIIAPGVEVSVTPDLSVLLRYYYSRVSGAGSGNAGSINFVLFPERRVSFSVGAAYGNETFLAGTVQQVVESTVVTTAAAGLTWRIVQGRGLRLNFEYEDRRDSYKKYGVGTSMFFEF